MRGVKRTTLKAKTPRDPSRYKTGKRHSVWIPPGQDEDETQHLRGQHAQAHTPGTHAHAHPRLLELTHGPKRVPAPSQPNGCGRRVHLPAPPPQRNPHPPFSVDKEGPRRPSRGEVPSPGGTRAPRLPRHALSARARLSKRSTQTAGQSLLFWHLETGLSVRGWRVWKAIFYLLNVVSLHRAHVNC